MDFDRIITSRPVNRAAAVAASGSRIDAPLTPEQKRENLVSLLHKLERTLKTNLEPEQRQRLGQRKLEVQNAIHALRLKISRPELHRCILDVVKEQMTKAQYLAVVEEAKKRYDQAIRDAANTSDTSPEPASPAQ